MLLEEHDESSSLLKNFTLSFNEHNCLLKMIVNLVDQKVNIKSTENKSFNNKK